jgi:hypothetical protein
MSAKLHHFEIPGGLLKRGFWLYIWRITAPNADVFHYVGRTGDSSSINAQSPFSRVSGHLGTNQSANQIQKHLSKHEVDILNCSKIELIALGPLLDEIKERDEHRRRRDVLAALERELCDHMVQSGYKVMNVVKSRKPLNQTLWNDVRLEFSKQFPNLVEM